MKKLIVVSMIVVSAMFSFGKDIPVTIYDNGTNINFTVNGGHINVICEGVVIDKEYDSIEIKVAEPHMEKCTIAYNIIVTSGDRYCELLINCRASNDRKLRFDEVISQMTESNESKKKFIVDVIENCFKIEEVVWIDRKTKKEV